jgi:hypothetical protein
MLNSVLLQLNRIASLSQCLVVGWVGLGLVHGGHQVPEPGILKQKVITFYCLVYGSKIFGKTSYQQK